MEFSVNQALINFIDHIYDSLNEDSILSWAERHFELKPFKLHEISMKESAFSHKMILKKEFFIEIRYADGKIENWSDEWHKNERKVFIEILLCFCKAMKKFPNSMENEDWEYLSSILFNKNPAFLKFQAFSLLKSNKKVLWANTDDELIRQFVNKCGEGNWNEASRLIFYKTNYQRYLSPKQIRERWYNHISQTVNKGPWTIEEDISLLEHVVHKNKHWCEIVKVLKRSRTEHMIKNRFKLLTKKFGNKNELLIKLIDELNEKSKRKRDEANKLDEFESEIGSETIKEKIKESKNSEISTSEIKGDSEYQISSFKYPSQFSKGFDNEPSPTFQFCPLIHQVPNLNGIHAFHQINQVHGFFGSSEKIWSEKLSSLEISQEAPILHFPLHQECSNYYAPNYFTSQSWPYYILESQNGVFDEDGMNLMKKH